MPCGLGGDLAREFGYGGVRDGSGQMSMHDHAGDVRVFDHQNLTFLHKGLRRLMNEMSPEVGDRLTRSSVLGSRSFGPLGPWCRS